MPSPLAQTPPSPDSPEFNRAIALIAERLRITKRLAEMAYGFYLGLGEAEMADWLHLRRCAVHERIRRLYQKPDMCNPGRVGGRVGEVLARG